jgi:hypothetical protein
MGGLRYKSLCANLETPTVEKGENEMWEEKSYLRPPEKVHGNA